MMWTSLNWVVNESKVETYKYNIGDGNNNNKNSYIEFRKVIVQTATIVARLTIHTYIYLYI